MSGPDVATLNAELVAAREELVLLTAAAKVADESYRLNYGDDMAMVSGTRRKPNARADARKYGANSRNAAAWAKASVAERAITILENRIRTAKRNAPVPYTPDELKYARNVRDRFGWHIVARVNAKSVTVKTPWSWTERIVLADIIEVRA